VTDTGRIRQGVGPVARRILFGDTVDHAIEPELSTIAEIDRAHLVMLAETRQVAPAAAAQLVAAVERMIGDQFGALRGRPAPRGAYLVYEEQLAALAGAEVAGILQTGRSRNDLNATVFAIRLRRTVAGLCEACAGLEATLLRQARRARAVAMPLSTHGQPALPGTYGFYLAGIASAVARDGAAMLGVLEGLGRCPLGAGAVGGTTLGIRPARTASLLGFVAPVRHAQDAVASRDTALRALASATLLGVTLSRAATDLLGMVSAGYLWLPDDLVGSSSMMPQKRNPFLLEHVQGKAAAALGAFAAAVTAMHAKPFTNCIAVGTEGTAPVWSALREIEHAVILLHLVVAGAEPVPETMRSAGERGMVIATELANRLVLHAGMPFRRAHYVVGTLVNVAHETGAPLAEVARAAQARGEIELAAEALDGLDVETVARATESGGGPGPAAFGACWGELVDEWRSRRRALGAHRTRWATAAEALDRATHTLIHDAREEP
jgi:argininosuccinate lyase